VRGDGYFLGSAMAAYLPIAVIYNFFVGQLVAGFIASAVK
jgi:hypothetical protein